VSGQWGHVSQLRHEQGAAGVLGADGAVRGGDPGHRSDAVHGRRRGQARRRRYARLALTFNLEVLYTQALALRRILINRNNFIKFVLF
jgi:hypothetical protein